MEPLLLSCIESRVENSRNFYGQFQLGPFVLGQGLTIANSLRRSLLSEISGLAITAVEIEGVVHEYSTIEGVRESVLDILLNVKQIVLTSDFQIQEPQIAFLQVQGPGIIRAKDIKLPISIQSVDPEQYIATLLYDGLLKIKFMICRGKNYLVQTPLGLKIPNSPPPSYKKQEEAFSELKAEVFLAKSSQSTKQNISSNPSLSKKPTQSSFASFLQIENLQDFTLDTSEGLANIPNKDISALIDTPTRSVRSKSPQVIGFAQAGGKEDVKEGSSVNKNFVFDYGANKSGAFDTKQTPKQQSKSVKEIMLKEEENNAVFTSHRPKIDLTSTEKMLEVSGSNNDVTIDLSNNIQSEKKNSSIYSTSSQEALLNTNRAEFSSFPNAEKKNTIDSKADITDIRRPERTLKKDGKAEVLVGDVKEEDFSFASGVGTRNKVQRVLGVGTRRDDPSESKSPSNISFGDVSLRRKKQISLGDVKRLEGGRGGVGDGRQKQKKELKTTSNILPIDAVFMPVNRVNFSIKLNDVSEAPKDLVILEIWTNGSIHPKQAINEAAKALIQLIAPFQEGQIFKPVFINSPKVLQKSLSSSCATVTNLGLPAQKKNNLKLLPLHNILTHINKVFVNPSDILKGHVSTKNKVFVNLDFPSETIDTPNIFFGASKYRSTPLTNISALIDISKKSVRSKSPQVMLTGGKGDVKVSAKQITVGDVKQGEREMSDVRQTFSKEMSKAGVTDKKSSICQEGPEKVAKQESTRVDGGKDRNSLLNKNLASLDIGNLNLSFRPYTCLKRAKIERVADLLQYSAEDLLNLKNLGKRSLDEISQNLNEMGLNLRS